MNLMHERIWKIIAFLHVSTQKKSMSMVLKKKKEEQKMYPEKWVIYIFSTILFLYYIKEYQCTQKIEQNPRYILSQYFKI